MYRIEARVLADLGAGVRKLSQALALALFYQCVSAAPAYFADDGLTSGSVSIVDTATSIALATKIAVPFGSIAAIPSQDGRWLFVVSRSSAGCCSDGILTVLATSDWHVVKTFATASNREAVAVSPDSRRVYVNAPGDKSIIVIDTVTMQVIAEVNMGGSTNSFAFSPDGKFVYAASSSYLQTIDTETYTVVAAMALEPLAGGAVANPSGTRVYLAHLGSPGKISVVDAASRLVMKVIEIAPDAVNLAVTPDGRRLYVAHNSGQLITVVDTSTNDVVATIPLDVAPYGLDVTTDGRLMYVASYGQRSVVVIDTQSNKVVSTLSGFPGVRNPGRFIGPEVGAVVEFYNPALDHYFVTSNLDEIADLDNGVHQGWVRTRQAFLAFATGSSQGQGLPTCRYYGRPTAGLDSHFYSASQPECKAVAAKFPDAWARESDNVFEIALPDVVTGMCTAGTLPVYRLWNNRADSNHRYTIHSNTRQEMLAKGYVPEGYGPNGVAMCAPARL